MVVVVVAVVVVVEVVVVVLDEGVGGVEPAHNSASVGKYCFES